MNNRHFKITFSLLLISIYSLLFFTVLNYPSKQDFTSFYSALLSLKNHESPYGTLYSNFLPLAKKLTPNLNPPTALWIFSPLTYFSYHTALLIWVTLSFTLGLIGAWIAFYYTFSIKFIKKYRVILFALYLAFFPTMINTVLAQFGSFLLFLLIVGYHFFLSNRHFIAGICWGLCVALKFFPALLFFFLFKQKRMNTFITVAISFFLFSLIPLIIYGVEIYSQYFLLLKRVFWYGDNWNASLYGYIFRLFGYHNKPYLEIAFPALFFILLIWYFLNLHPYKTERINHQPFCLTLAMMLLISPFGWLYYFPILVFPLALIWANAVQEKTLTNKTMLLWLFCLFLINLPQGYVITGNMQNFAVRLLPSSFYFYGLVLLNYLLMKKTTFSGNNEIELEHSEYQFLYILFFIFLFAAVITPLKIILTG